MAEHNNLGKEGEEEAAIYLEERGYVLRHRNWHSGRYELDIVAKKDGYLVVVEVKTRRDRQFGTPQDAVTGRKIRHIVASTDAYLKMFALDIPVRFDIITLVGRKPPFMIEHIQEAFFPPLW